MATLAFSVVGAVAGFAIGGPIGANIGLIVGGIVGQLLFPTPQPPQPAQQISNSTYGSVIPLGWGTIVMPANLVWASQRRETDPNALGKGGMMGGSQQTGPTFQQDMFFVCGVGRNGSKPLRIWFNSKLVYDLSPANDSSNNVIDNPVSFRWYDGRETQMPDSLIVADRGANAVSAYRGLTGIMFDNADITDGGGVIPTVQVEVAFAPEDANSYRYGTDIVGGLSGTSTSTMAFDPVRRLTYMLDNTTHGLRVYNIDSMTEVRQQTYPNEGALEASSGQYLYMSYFTGVTFGNLQKIDPNSLAVIQEVGEGNLAAELLSVVVTDPTGLGLRHFIVTATVFGDSGSVIDVDHMAYLKDYTGDFTGGQKIYGMCGGVAENGLATAYVARQDGGNDPVVIQKISLSPGAQILPDSSVFGVSVVDIITLPSTLWESHGVQLCGMAFNPSDKMLLVWVNHNSTNGSYVIKVDPSTGDVAWVVKTSTSVSGPGDIRISSITNNVIAWCSVHSGTATATMIDTHTGEIIIDALELDTILPSPGASIQAGGRSFFDGESQSIISQSASHNLVQIFLGRLSGQGETIGNIVADISEIEGLDRTNDIDVSELTDTIPGYVIGNQTDGRSAVEQLSGMFFFDAAESGTKVVFKKRGRVSTITINEDDMIPLNDNGDVLTKTRLDETILPERLAITYLSPFHQYENRTAAHRRVREPTPVMFSRDPQTVQVPMAFGADQIAQIVESMLYTIWNERVSVQWQLPWQFLTLDCADVVTLVVKGKSYRVRITSNPVGVNLVMACEGVIESAATIVSTAQGDDGISQPVPAWPNGTIPTVLFILDIPLLRDVDDTPATTDRLYIAFSGYNSLWTGATLWDSDNGASFTNTGIRSTTRASFGSISNHLPTTDSPFVTDNDTVLRVSMASGNLSGVGDIDFLNDVNVAIVGSSFTNNWEIIDFKNVVQQTDGSYLVSGIMRGRRGSETMCNTHSDGEFFIVPTPGTFTSELLATADLNMVRYYRGVSFGQVPESVVPQSLNATGAALKPYAPAQLTALVSGSDIDLAWVRRNRIAGELRDGSGLVPMSEESEAYSIDILTGPPSTSWNPADKNVDMVLSDRNLTVTNDGLGASGTLVRSILSHASGKKYYEFKVLVGTGILRIGLASGSSTLAEYPGHDLLKSIGIAVGSTSNGVVFFNNSSVITGPSFAVNDFGGVAIDFDAKLIWFRNNSAPTVWNTGGTDSPITGLGGVDFSLMTGSPFYAAVGASVDNNSLTANFGSLPFNAVPPATYDIWGGDLDAGLMRTLTSSVNSVTYSAANITADFGSIPDSISFIVYQISTAVGRGYGGKTTIDL